MAAPAAPNATAFPLRRAANRLAAPMGNQAIGRWPATRQSTRRPAYRDRGWVHTCGFTQSEDAPLRVNPWTYSARLVYDAVIDDWRVEPRAAVAIQALPKHTGLLKGDDTHARVRLHASKTAQALIRATPNEPSRQASHGFLRAERAGRQRAARAPSVSTAAHTQTRAAREAFLIKRSEEQGWEHWMTAGGEGRCVLALHMAASARCTQTRVQQGAHRGCRDAHERRNDIVNFNRCRRRIENAVVGEHDAELVGGRPIMVRDVPNLRLRTTTAQ